MFSKLSYVDSDTVIGTVIGVVLLLAVLAGLAAFVWADATHQCWGPAFDTYRDACVNGHAVGR